MMHVESLGTYEAIDIGVKVSYTVYDYELGVKTEAIVEE
jgi:hypothetical protein